MKKAMVTGDLNGDGKPDILERAGWWEQRHYLEHRYENLSPNLKLADAARRSSLRVWEEIPRQPRASRMRCG
mgnify:CR=1 FL=1